jgi:hypothetical protein
MRIYMHPAALLALATALTTACATTTDGTNSFASASPDAGNGDNGQGGRPSVGSDNADAGALADSASDTTRPPLTTPGPDAASTPDSAAVPDTQLIPGGGPGADASATDAGATDAGSDAGSDAGLDAGGEPTPTEPAPVRIGDSCGFGYGFPEGGATRGLERETRAQARIVRRVERPFDNSVATIAHVEPAPLRHGTLRVWPENGEKRNIPEDLVIPIYEDDTPLFDRAIDWDGEPRCYELPDGAWEMTEAQAYDTWVGLVEATLWYSVDQTPGHRNVVGLRGAVPGSFNWSGNTPNFFNDTIVLLWRDDDGVPHVREFPVNTDTGNHDFGRDSSSSLVPNRHYPYVNGWHRSYNALRINLPSYPVRDDANNNGHWDDERNGWLDGGEPDYDRLGSAHNIHMGAIDVPLGDAPINTWSAGCQVIPGEENWLEFIGNAWTGLNDDVDYYLVDARDIAPTFFSPCEGRDGSHACPFEVRAFPYSHTDDTSTATDSVYDAYNCSAANESGGEHVYVVNLAAPATLTVRVTTPDDDNVDPDIQVLSGDDADACLARAHRELTLNTNIGRYVIVVDSWTGSDGVPLEGEYTLEVDAVPR